jgi:hypothetical protein
MEAITMRAGVAVAAHVRLSLLLRPPEVVLVSRFASRSGLVTLRQTFVRRCHGSDQCPCRGLKHEQSELFSPEF